MSSFINEEPTPDTSKTEGPTETLVPSLSYVEDEPIIRQIGGRNLYLGNWLAADPAFHDRTFDHVLTVSQDEYPLTTHHHPLRDGPATEWPSFERAVNVARSLHRQEGTLLIHCNSGISRSSTVIGAVLAAEEDRPFRAALDIIHESRPNAVPHPVIHELAVIYLAALE